MPRADEKVKRAKAGQQAKARSPNVPGPPSPGTASSTATRPAHRAWAALASPRGSPGILRPLEATLKYAAVACACAYVVLYVFVAILRIRYPFDLEWIEGGMVEHVRRILAGQPLYVVPSLDFVAFIYPPLYYYVGAGLSLVMGVGLLPLRLISLVSSIGCFVLLFLFVKRETEDAAAGILAAGLYAATFRQSGAWFDLARVDSLFLALLLAGFYLIRFGVSARAHVAAGLCLSLSFLTKQTAAVMFLPVVLYAAAKNWRLGAPLLATLLLCAGGTIVALDVLHHGWFAYYVFQLPSQHRLLPDRWIGFWTQDILRPLWIACALAVIALVRAARRDWASFMFLLLLAVGMLGGSWMSRIKLGAYDNVLMPVHAGLALLFGMAAQVPARTQEPEVQRPKKPARRGVAPAPGAGWNAMRLVGPSVVFLFSIVQLALLLYDPARQIPSRADEAAGFEVVAAIAQIPGPVFVPAHGYLATLAGKRSYAHQAAVWDVYGGARNDARHQLAQELGRALREPAFSALVMDGVDVLEPHLIARNYIEVRSLFGTRDVFWPVAGMRTRPEIVYVPRR